MEAAGDRLIEETILHPSNTAIIREIYERGYDQEHFSMELERALDANYDVIIIEPYKLGDETARWISVGNYLQKTAVISGIGAIISGLIWSDRPLFYGPLLSLSLICTGLYTVSWQFDPCVKYQVKKDSKKKSSSTPNLSPVVLVRKNDTRHKVLWCSTISILSAAFCAYRIYQCTK